jgi:hypothetical protein
VDETARLPPPAQPELRNSSPAGGLTISG